MANTPGTKIHWADKLVEHFSSFFPSQWDRIVADSIADAQLPWHDTAYTIATLQEILDCITEAAQQAVGKGFSPSLRYSKTLPASAKPPYSEASLKVMRDVLERILATDRRNYGVRNGLISCGDFWFHGIRLALKSELPTDCLDDHATTAQYFGKSGYTAMLCSGRSADSLRKQAGDESMLPVFSSSISDLSHYGADSGGLEFRHLQIMAEPETPPPSLEHLSFSDCEFGSGSVDKLTHAQLSNCRLMSDASLHYEYVRFNDCSITDCPITAPAGEEEETGTTAVPNSGPLEFKFGLGHRFGPPGSAGILPATGRRPVIQWRQGQGCDHLGRSDDQSLEFRHCRFDTPLFEANTIDPHLQDCRFAGNRLHGIDIASLSGDYSLTDIEQCRITHISPDTRIGKLTNSIIGTADQAQFSGDLEDVKFLNGTNACRFGDQQATQMTRVSFGHPDTEAVLGEGQVIDCSFAKHLRLDRVSFHCLLQDPTFLGTTTGIDTIEHFKASKQFRPSLTGIEFGRIETSRKGIVYNVVGGSIIDLDANIEHLSHTVIETVGKNARIGTYEIIMDRSLREQWHIKNNLTLIGTIEGRIDKLSFMGEKCGEYFVDEVSGEIAELHHCIKIRRLEKGARVVFSEDTDIESVFRKKQIIGFNGGEFGVWEQSDGEKSIRYFYDDKDYHQRHMIDNVKDIFDAFG